jgi:hypothetical protein
VEHWQAKKNGNYPNKNQSFSHDQKISKVCSLLEKQLLTTKIVVVKSPTLVVKRH